MASSWDDVGRQFAELGRSLQSAWEDACASDAGAGVKDAGQRVTDVIDDLAATVNRVAGSPELRDTVVSAGSSVADAIASSLHTVADLIANATPRPQDARPADEPPQDDVPPEGANGASNGKNGTSKGDD